MTSVAIIFALTLSGKVWTFSGGYYLLIELKWDAILSAATVGGMFSSINSGIEKVCDCDSFILEPKFPIKLRQVAFFQ